MFEKFNLERGIALLMGYASRDLETWVIAIIFGRPESDFLFKIVDNDFKEKVIENAGMEIKEISVVRADLDWFWMRPFPPKDIKHVFQESLYLGMIELDIIDENCLIERKKLLEKEIKKEIKKRLGEKSMARVKLNVFQKNKKRIENPEFVLRAA